MIKIPTLADLPPPPPGRTGWPWTEPPPPVGALDWPTFNIVTPSFNQAPFLEAALRSVLLQGCPSLSYVVMDGGSTDGSADIIRRYGSWLTTYVIAPDGGQCQAINDGFARGQGQIMAWLNSDDLYAPGALAAVARALGRRESALAVGASILTDGPETLRGKRDERRPTWPEMIYDARSWPQPSVFWTADLWARSGRLDEALYFLMDYDLWLRMRPAAAALVYLPDVLSYARTHPGQKSLEPDRAALYQELRVRVALAAARRRGQPAWAWLARIWLRRCLLAIRKRKPVLLKGGPYHRLALRMVRAGTNRP